MHDVSLFLQREDYKAFVTEQCWTVHVMQYLRAIGRDDSELDPEKYCERGLESYQSKERRTEIDMKRKLHKLMVIHEQARQAILGTKDPEQIRLMAAPQSEGSLLRAQMRAALDQHEAQQAISNGGTQKIPTLQDVEAASESHNSSLMAQSPILEEQQLQSNGQEYLPTRPQEFTDDEDAQELTIAGTVPLASLFSEKSIFSKDSSSDESSLAGNVGHTSTSQRVPKHEDGTEPRLISCRSAVPLSTGKLPATAVRTQRGHSVTEFLRNARGVRLASASARCHLQPGISIQTPIPFVSLNVTRINGVTSISGNEISPRFPFSGSNVNDSHKDNLNLASLFHATSLDSKMPTHHAT
jgi:hypothetical protein